MSFGWSASDIVAAINLLHKVGVALRESGGASSEYQDTVAFLQTLSWTLQHISTLQNVGHDPGFSENLQIHCEQLRVPLEAFLSDIKGRFGPSLGCDTKWYNLVPASRKLRWALSISRKVKELQLRILGPMTAIGMIMVHLTSWVHPVDPELSKMQRQISRMFN
jgi:hypothetical protein